MWGESLDLVYDLGGLLTSPRTTFRIMRAEGRGLGYAVLVLCLFSAATAVSVSTAFFYGLAMPYLGAFAGVAAYFLSLSVPVIAALAIVADVIRWLIESALAYALVKVFRGRPTYEGLLLVIGYSRVCRVPLVITALASLVTGGLTTLALIAIGFVISLILGVIIESIGISETQSLGTGASVAVVVLTLLIEVAVIIGICLGTSLIT